MRKDGQKSTYHAFSFLSGSITEVVTFYCKSVLDQVTGHRNTHVSHTNKPDLLGLGGRELSGYGSKKHVFLFLFLIKWLRNFNLNQGFIIYVLRNKIEISKQMSIKNIWDI